MVVKKKAAAKPANFGKKVDAFKSNVKKEAKFVEDESKVIATGIGKWWGKSSNEEKVYTLLGILLLIWGLYQLRTMVWGLLLIIAGILFVTGYFIKKK